MELAPHRSLNTLFGKLQYDFCHVTNNNFKDLNSFILKEIFPFSPPYLQQDFSCSYLQKRKTGIELIQNFALFFNSHLGIHKLSEKVLIYFTWRCSSNTFSLFMVHNYQNVNHIHISRSYSVKCIELIIVTVIQYRIQEI